ncbi:MAG: cobalamin-dependent protein [Deltaproteobacteria bacterium]|nr:cobalamin-dependent protein [Deltaproteobacteria bacterium]MBW2199911.1 cobalamin-dependent protein [Deltaproteobacteria bacterium]MBW2540120.1 cobalamin-dependent protein [Deltaproteobacteria bacterium]
MAGKENPIKILLAKCGMDGHDRGIVMLSQWFRNEGMEVVYLGPYQTPKSVARAALQEDVEMVGLSFLSGGHVLHSTNTVKSLKEIGLDIPLLVGGIIPKVDIPPLKEAGVNRVFPAGTPVEEITDYIKEAVEDRRA